MKTWYLTLPDAVRAGINTAWQSAVGSFVLLMLGFLAKVQEYFGSTDPAAQFPAVSPLGKAIGSILVGLVTGVLVAVYRYFKPGPSYSSSPAGEPNRDAGQAFVATLCYILGAIVLAGIILFWVLDHK